MTGFVPERLAMVLALALLPAPLAACATPSKGMAMHPDDAQREAIASLHDAMSLSDEPWPGVPDPVVNECEHAGVDGVQFTYLAMVEKPRDPGAFHQAMVTYWRDAGYDVVPIRSESGTAAGTTFDATIRKAGAPWLSYAASDALIGLYVDSQCAEGAPDDFRPSTW